MVHYRPPAETFHEFLWHMVKWEVGKDWYMAEVAKPYADRHQLVKWFYDLHDWQLCSREGTTTSRFGAAARGPAVRVCAVVDLSRVRHLHTQAHW